MSPRRSPPGGRPIASRVTTRNRRFLNPLRSSIVHLRTIDTPCAARQQTSASFPKSRDTLARWKTARHVWRIVANSGRCWPIPGRCGPRHYISLHFGDTCVSGSIAGPRAREKCHILSPSPPTFIRQNENNTVHDPINWPIAVNRILPVQRTASPCRRAPAATAGSGGSVRAGRGGRSIDRDTHSATPPSADRATAPGTRPRPFVAATARRRSADERSIDPSPVPHHASLSTATSAHPGRARGR